MIRSRLVYLRTSIKLSWEEGGYSAPKPGLHQRVVPQVYTEQSMGLERTEAVNLRPTWCSPTIGNGYAVRNETLQTNFRCGIGSV